MKKLLALIFTLCLAVAAQAGELEPDYYFTAESLLDKVEDGGAVTEWPDSKNQVKFIIPQKTKRPVKAPVFKERGLEGNPAICFDKEIRTLYIPGFVNEVMAGKSYTFIYAGISITGNFGFAGNVSDGSFYTPPLAMHCGSFSYGKVKAPLLTSINYYRVNAFTCDVEKKLIATYHNGYPKGKAAIEPIAKFGGGGHLVLPAMPWAHAPRQGMITEIMVFKRALTPQEIKKICGAMIAKHRAP
ncbi:MAG: hypothetical protein IJC27_01240 [Lentisphaeria bacterium]|nr:hypothetical protein [Lentisphaeria bacterium]